MDCNDTSCCPTTTAVQPGAAQPSAVRPSAAQPSAVRPSAAQPSAVRPSAAQPKPCCTLDIEGPDQERLVTLFKALGNPIRFEILKYLITHPGCITGNLVDHLPIAQATVSQHLKVLRSAGWIQGTVQGPATCYCLDAETARWFRERVSSVF